MTADEFMEVVFNGTNNDSRVTEVEPMMDGSWSVDLDDGSTWCITIEEVK